MFEEPVGWRLVESGAVGLVAGWAVLAGWVWAYAVWWRLRGEASDAVPGTSPFADGE